jgi:hypothetical protein
MGWKFTSWACGQALEKNPTFATAMVREGHEVAAHGMRWLEIWDYTLEEDYNYIKENCESIKKTTGSFPRGVFFGRGTPNTKALFPEVLRDIGGELLYSSETAFNDDVPYVSFLGCLRRRVSKWLADLVQWIDLPAEKELKDDEKKGMLIVPYNYDCNGWSPIPSPCFALCILMSCCRWQITHESRLRGFDHVSGLPEKHIRYALPRRMQWRTKAHEHPDAFSHCGQAGEIGGIEDFHVVCERT